MITILNYCRIITDDHESKRKKSKRFTQKQTRRSTNKKEKKRRGYIYSRLITCSHVYSREFLSDGRENNKHSSGAMASRDEFDFLAVRSQGISDSIPSKYSQRGLNRKKKKDSTKSVRVSV